MKLYLNNSNKFIDVEFLSFMKITFLSQLAITGFIYGICLIAGIILALIGIK